MTEALELRELFTSADQVVWEDSFLGTASMLLDRVEKAMFNSTFR